MKYIKYAFYSVASRPVFNIVIILELAAILIAGNMLISVVNSRYVYYAPYADLISREGYVLVPTIKENFQKDMDSKKMYDSLEGDVEAVYGYGLQIASESDVLREPAADGSYKYRNALSFDERIFSRFNTPLTAGRWASTTKNEKGQIEMVAVLFSETDLQVGDTFDFSVPVWNEEAKEITYDPVGEAVIVGTIDSQLYYPDIMLSGSAQTTNGKTQLRDVRNMYSVGTSGIDSATFLVSAAAAPQLKDDRFIGKSTAFLTYRSEPTDSQRQANLETLTAQRGTVYKMSEFKSNSDLYLYEQYIKLLPILIGVFVIVLAELICSVALHTKKQMRNYGIYFLCGCRWRDCLKISIAYSALLLAASAVIGTAAFLIFQTTSYARMFEQNLGVNNITITLGLVAAMLAVSLVIPFFMVRRTSPTELIKEN